MSFNPYRDHVVRVERHYSGGYTVTVIDLAARQQGLFEAQAIPYERFDAAIAAAQALSNWMSIPVEVTYATELSSRIEGHKTSTNAPQPSPKTNEHPAVWDLVSRDMKERDNLGRQKYGTPLQPFNGRDALTDAYQEALDLAVYLRQAIYERDKK